MNQLFYGDNLDVLQKYIGDETVDLCYVDPPFNSKRNYNQIYNNIGKDDIAQTQAFVDTWEWGHSAELYLDMLRKEPQYTRRLVDTVIGLEKILGKGAMLAYLVNMAVRFAEIWRVLKRTGSFYVHCDPTASHYLKIILDSIFCDRGGNFVNEIIWHYKGNSVPKYCLPRKHDIIFWYSKDKKPRFNPNDVLVPYAELTHKRYNHVDEQGRRYKISALRNGKQEIVYMKEGKYPDDVWDIPIARGGEQLGYGTQKPLALLERIVKAASNEGDVVLDAFCGCGTTVDAAHSLNRKWVGIDITSNAVLLIIKRLIDRYGKNILDDIVISGIPRDIKSARALANKKDDRLRKEFEKWAILTYTDNHAKINDKKGSDRGIDGIAYIFGDNMVVFSVKSGNVSVKDIRDLRGVMERENAVAGVLLSLEEPTKPMLQEAVASGYMEDIPNSAGLKMPRQTPKLRIVTIQELLDGARMNLPLTESVVKSAERHKHKGKNQHINFEDDANT